VLDILLRLIVFIVGVLIVVKALGSAIRVLVLPRKANDPLARVVFRTTRRLFDIRAKRARTYEERDEIMAMYAPVSLLCLPAVWLSVVLIGYQALFWSLGVHGWQAAFKLSGSSLLTLGFSDVSDLIPIALSFSEASIGLILVALLIAYLPTIYAGFSRREALVTLLEVRAGSPPSAAELIERFHRLGRMHLLTDMWKSWEEWFVDIEETHTSLAALPFFRSPQGHRSWVTAAGAVLDAASLAASTLDLPRDPQQDLCIRAGFLSLRYIASFFQIDYQNNPTVDDPISVARIEYDAVCDRLAAAGVPLKSDRDETWRHFRGWRVNYDTVLLGLAALTMAPEALVVGPFSPDSATRQEKDAEGARERTTGRSHADP
jgi:hypothetical protein